MYTTLVHNIILGDFKKLKDQLNLHKNSLLILNLQDNLKKFLKPLIKKIKKEKKYETLKKNKEKEKNLNIASLEKFKNENQEESIKHQAIIKSTPKTFLTSSINFKESNHFSIEENTQSKKSKMSKVESVINVSEEMEEFNIYDFSSEDNDYNSDNLNNTKDGEKDTQIMNLKQQVKDLNKKLNLYKNKYHILENFIDLMDIKTEKCISLLKQKNLFH